MQDFATIDFELANNERSSVYSVSLVIVRCRGDSVSWRCCKTAFK